MRRPYSTMNNPYAPVYSGYRPFPPNWYYGPHSPANARAGGVVQALWGSNVNQNSKMGRKSTAQPRPVLKVPPGGIGPIANPNENDVLCGRGGRINFHVGNIQFRKIINSRKNEYLAKTTKKLEKAHIAAAIVNEIRSMKPPGRFLKEDGKSGMWFDIGDAKAIKKTGQALREDAPEIRPQIDEEASSGDEKNVKGEETKKAAASTPKDMSNSPRSRKDKSSSATSPNADAHQQAPTAFNGFGHQLLPGAWQNQTVQDHQGQAAMPSPFQAQSNPYLMQQGQRQTQRTFEPRSIPIPVPRHLYNMPNHIFSESKKGSNASKQVMDALAKEDTAFGKTFHPPASAVGSEKTNSTISALTDPGASNLSAFGMASDSFRPSDVAGSFQGSIAQSSSFPDMASMPSFVDDDSFKRIMECDEEIEAPESILSGSTRASNRASGMSKMSIGSRTSSSQSMNCSSYDERSILSDMSSDLHALNLAS